MRLAPLALAALLSAPSARASAPGEEAARSYHLDTAGSTATVAAGGAGKLVIAIVPNAGIHVHPQAPLKITLEATGLELAKTSLGHKDAVDPAAEGPRFEIPFTARAAGAQEVKAKVDFFVCSDRWCVKQVRELVLPVQVFAPRATLPGWGPDELSSAGRGGPFTPSVAAEPRSRGASPPGIQ